PGPHQVLDVPAAARRAHHARVLRDDVRRAPRGGAAGAALAPRGALAHSGGAADRPLPPRSGRRGARGRAGGLRGPLGGAARGAQPGRVAAAPADHPQVGGLSDADGPDRGGHGVSAPPSFAEARGRREKARAAGLHPDYWYAVEYDRALRPGALKEVTFWGTSIALWRDTLGQLHAVENRCAHRQLKLSLGSVEGCRLACAYHGWGYDANGQLAHIPHELFGRPMPDVRLRTYPLRVRYGLIWIFPGDPALAETRRLPDIPELEGPDPWPCVPLDFTWRAHHSMIVDNVSDFTHAWLHRKYR